MTPFHKLIPALAMLFVLSGCAAAAIQGASRASDQVTIAANESDANAGDARAQYKLGMAHCCTIAGSMGVLNNQKATEWFCKAAAQNNADAQYELGRIYSGDLVRGINGPAKIGALLTKQPENNVLALMWLGLAATNGNKDAIEATRHLSKKMTQDEIDDATARSENPQVQPCEWNDVYPNNQI